VEGARSAAAVKSNAAPLTRMSLAEGEGMNAKQKNKAAAKVSSPPPPLTLIDFSHVASHFRLSRFHSSDADACVTQIVEDKTFGLKNKKKSKKVQNYVNEVTKNAKNSVNPPDPLRFLEKHAHLISSFVSSWTGNNRRKKTSRRRLR
jgi:hypothetical protein